MTYIRPIAVTPGSQEVTVAFKFISGRSVKDQISDRVIGFRNMKIRLRHSNFGKTIGNKTNTSVGTSTAVAWLSNVWNFNIPKTKDLVEKVQFFNKYTPAKMAVFCLHLPDDGGSKDLWNVCKLLPDDTAQQPRRQPSSYSPPWEPKSHQVYSHRRENLRFYKIYVKSHQSYQCFCFTIEYAMLNGPATAMLQFTASKSSLNEKSWDTGTQPHRATRWNVCMIGGPATTAT
jgi:hypothetical protein